MNIFFLHDSPAICAAWHIDKHVTKMLIEYAQLLSTAHYVLDGKQVGYKPTHKNHPCAVWVRRSSTNYLWLFQLWRMLDIQYTIRYGKLHKSATLAEALEKLPDNIPKCYLIDPPQCIPDDCKVPSNTTQAYRNYYMKYKSAIAKWKHGNVPYWYVKPDAGISPIIKP